MKTLDATAKGLGLISAQELLSDTTDREGISQENVQNMLNPDEDEDFPTIYDRAMVTLSTQRAVYGSLQSRLEHVLNYMDVYQENIAAAKSKISDSDFAEEASRLLKSQVMARASSALMAQGNMQANNMMQILNSII
jgi:flagellin